MASTSPCARWHPQHAQSVVTPLAVPQLGSCAFPGLWAWRSQKEASPLGAQPLPRVLEAPQPLMSPPLTTQETSVAYAVWSAVVMAALSVVGIVFLNESKSRLKFAGVTSIIFGTICLSWADGQK